MHTHDDSDPPTRGKTTDLKNTGAVPATNKPVTKATKHSATQETTPKTFQTQIDERELYLTTCNELNIFPKPALISRRRAEGFVMKHYGAGDKTVQAIASGIKLMQGIKVLQLSDNRWV
jgi:hypothetical protein